MSFSSEVSRMLLSGKTASPGLQHNHAHHHAALSSNSAKSLLLHANQLQTRVGALSPVYSSGSGGGGGARSDPGGRSASAVSSGGGGSSSSAVLRGGLVAVGGSVQKKRAAAAAAAAASSLASGVVASSSTLSNYSGSSSGSSSRSFLLSAAPSSSSSSSVSGGFFAADGQQLLVRFRGQQTSVGFLLNKLVELLKQHAGRSLHVKEVEKHLIQAGFSSLHLFFAAQSEFLKFLSSSERVAYNPMNRTLAYHNPFQAITSSSALLAKIQYDGALTGLKVDPELLSAHPDMEKWIHGLLMQRRIRAVRCSNSHLRGKKKCALISGAGTQGSTATACDIYASRKCSNCMQNLCGLLLYPLTDDIYEEARLSLDAEVKALWDSIPLPSVDDLRKECNLSGAGSFHASASGLNDKSQLKRRPEAKRATRYRNKFRRIQNTHLFTAEELRAFTYQYNANG